MPSQRNKKLIVWRPWSDHFGIVWRLSTEKYKLQGHYICEFTQLQHNTPSWVWRNWRISVSAFWLWRRNGLAWVSWKVTSLVPQIEFMKHLWEMEEICLPHITKSQIWSVWWMEGSSTGWQPDLWASTCENQPVTQTLSEQNTGSPLTSALSSRPSAPSSFLANCAFLTIFDHSLHTLLFFLFSLFSTFLHWPSPLSSLGNNDLL